MLWHSPRLMRVACTLGQGFLCSATVLSVVVSGPTMAQTTIGAPQTPAQVDRLRGRAPASPPSIAPPASPSVAEDPLVAAAGDELIPSPLRNLRDALPHDPERVMRDAGLRPRRSRPIDLRTAPGLPSAQEFGAALGRPR